MLKIAHSNENRLFEKWFSFDHINIPLKVTNER
jgi:hypothetical protein